MSGKGQYIFMEGFSDDELHKVAKNPSIVKTLSKIAKERYPRYWRLALNCLQAGFSLALQVNELNEAPQNVQPDRAFTVAPQVVKRSSPATRDLPYMCSDCGADRAEFDPCPECGRP